MATATETSAKPRTIPTEPVLGEHVVEEQVVFPLIGDFLAVGSAVGIDDEGNGGGIG